MRFSPALRASLLCFLPILACGQQVSSPTPPAAIIGTATDFQGDVVPGAAITLDGPSSNEHAVTTADGNGFFVFRNLRAGTPYRVTVSAKGFANWTSQPITLDPGQQFELSGVKLTLAVVQTTVSAVSEEQIATQEVKTAEQQRVLGVFPNFYVVYTQHPVPLTTKLKYELALRASVDPVNFAGVAIFAAIDQAGDVPDYQQGFKGYAQRFGAGYTDGFTDIMIGGAILPSLLHQDPRYFYQGTGTIKSRIWHAVSTAFLCPGDNGHMQINYSSIGGDLASGALSNLYYPSSNRGTAIVFDNALLSAGGRAANALAQEFLFRRFTTHSKGQN